MKKHLFFLFLGIVSFAKAQTNTDYLKEINRDIWQPFIEAYSTLNVEKYKNLQIEVGGEGAPAAVPAIRGPLSRLKRGLLRIWSALLNRESIPSGTIQHHDWPATTTTADVLLEPYVHEG